MRGISKLGIKLVAIVLIFVLIPLAVIYFLTGNGAKDILTRQIKAINEKTTRSIYEEINSFLASAKNATDEFSRSATVDIFLTGVKSGMAQYVNDGIDKFLTNNSWAERVDLLAESGETLTYPEAAAGKAQAGSNDWYSGLKETQEPMLLLPSSPQGNFRLAYPIRMSFSGEFSGAMVVYIEKGRFSQILESHFVENGSALLINSSGNVLATSAKEKLAQESFGEMAFFADLFATEDIQYEIYDYLNQSRLTFSKYISELNSVLLLQLPENKVFSEVDGLLANIRWVGLGSLFLIIIITLFVSNNLIASRVVQVARGAQTVSEGDLQQEITVRGKDEIGRLAQSFNEMALNLRTLIKDILEHAEKVTYSSNQIYESAEVSNQISVQVANSIQQVASGAERQTEFIEEVNHKLLNLEKSMRGLTDTSTTVQEIAENTQTKASRGNASIQEVSKQMDVIQNSMADAGAVIDQMTQAADQISNFVNIIDNIANQTNLLALNASIEAARAGEEGRGFAVVAGEIGSLAAEVLTSAGQIRQLVKSTQDYSHQAAVAMREGIEQIQVGQDVIQQSGTIFDDIFDSFETTLQSIKKVYNMTSHVAKETDEILGSAENIASISEENAASAEEVSASTEEQSAAMDEITTLAQNLTELSESLKKMVEAFKI